MPYFPSIGLFGTVTVIVLDFRVTSTSTSVLSISFTFFFVSLLSNTALTALYTLPSVSLWTFNVIGSASLIYLLSPKLASVIV